MLKVRLVKGLLLLFVSLFVFVNYSYAHQMPIVIDTDLGTDDFQALAMFAHNPHVNIKAITVLGDGENTCAVGMGQLRRFLMLAHLSHIPTACNTLKWPAVKLPWLWHLEMNWFNSTPVANSEYNHYPVRLLIKTLRHTSKPVTIVALASLTHLQQLREQQSNLFDKHVKQVYFTGDDGVKKMSQLRQFNSWNVRLDPKAFSYVLSHVKNFYMVSRKEQYSLNLVEIYKQLPALKNPLAQFAYAILNNNRFDWFVGDQVTAILTLNPKLCRWRLFSTLSSQSAKTCLQMKQETFTHQYLTLLR